MSDIKKYYDGIVMKQGPEELAQAIINSAVEQPERKMRFKPLSAVVAAAVMLAVGVSGAAAAGLIDFNTIFGGKIVANDEQLANSLMAAAENLEWTISDDDYMIEFKGLTGSESDMILLYNITRRDGKPVTDFMTNIPEDRVLYCMEYNDFRAPGEAEGSRSIKNSGFGQSWNDNRYTINADGNIEVYKRVSTDGCIAGQYYSEELVNIYPDNILSRFTNDRNIFLWGNWSEDIPMGFYSDDDDGFERGQPVDILLNDEQIIGLELEWSVGFTYMPSKCGMKNKSITDDKGEIKMNYLTPYGGLATAEFNVAESQFSSLGGRIELVSYGAELKGCNLKDCNDISLVIDDNSEIICTAIAHCYSYNRQNGKNEMSAQIQYSDTIDGNIIAVDITKVKAISINGTVYPIA